MTGSNLIQTFRAVSVKTVADGRSENERTITQKVILQPLAAKSRILSRIILREILVDKVALRRTVRRILLLSPHGIIPQTCHSHSSSTYDTQGLISAINRVVK